MSAMKKYMERLTLFVMAQPHTSAYLIVTLTFCWAFAVLAWLVK